MNNQIKTVYAANCRANSQANCNFKQTVFFQNILKYFRKVILLKCKAFDNNVVLLILIGKDSCKCTGNTPKLMSKALFVSVED